MADFVVSESSDLAVFHLRNECNFWKGRGIMNTSGLLQSKRGFTNFARDTKYS